MADEMPVNLERWREALARRTRDWPALGSGDPREGVCCVWAVWGESHVREALASAVLAACANRLHYPMTRHVVFVYGPAESWMLAQRAAVGEWGVEIEMAGSRPPADPALYDIPRWETMAAIGSGRHVVYMDSDIYCFEPLDMRRLLAPVTLYALGTSRGQLSQEYNHRLVEELIGAPSSLFYADLGIRREDYMSPSIFWPQLRYNIGMLHAQSTNELADFAREFAALHKPLVPHQLFGFGEMLFTAMYNRGDLPGMAVDFASGWARVWPFWPNQDSVARVVVDQHARAIVDFVPPYAKPIFHSGHFTRQFFTHEDPANRPMWFEWRDDGRLWAHFTYGMPQIQTVARFERVDGA